MQSIAIFGDLGFAVTVDSLMAQLDATTKTTPLVVQINSQGGSVAEAIAIYNVLRAWPGGCDVEIVGWALSAATIVAMAGHTIRAHETALMMIHAPWLDTSGNAEQLRQRADTLDTVAETMRLAYARTKQSAGVIGGWLDGTDHWFTAEQALAAGLVDEVIAETAEAASRLDVMACRYRVPSHLMKGPVPMPQASPAAAAGPDAEQIRAEGARAEGERQAHIRAAFARHMSVAGAAELQERCLADARVTEQAAKARLLELVGAGAEPLAGHYAVVVGEGARDSRMTDFCAAAADVILMRAGMRIAEPHPAVADVRRLSIVAMAERVLSMRGIATREKSNAEIISASLSTSDFPALLAAVSGKALRAGYENAPATFAGWTGEREVADFKKQTLVALSEAPSLQKVGEGADYKYGKFDDSASTFTVETYGRIVKITRQALINDDTSAFTTLPQSFGAAARRLEADLVYATLTSNPTLADGVALFHANHGNLGAAGAVSLTTLGEARASMRVQKGIQGLGYVDPQPRYLVVPVAMETACEQLLASLVDPTKSNATPNAEWVRGLSLVADPRLDAVSTTVWYLSAAPQQIEGIVRGYLEGEQRPYLEEKAEFERDVVAFKTRLDVCSGVIDHRALYRRG